ncbi:MAG: class I SAM-dependent methyltransferase [Cyclobacteriaceae bacterium]|nr:class I SAM-dependent methyltransferase [Cyclobacteriaceae bacterium]
MNITDIINNSNKPQLYEKGDSVMWTDSHISKQLLNVHLNSEIDLASRKTNTIKSTVEWILRSADLRNLNILDLGCGPGLYSEILAKKGHKVTGVDFSAHSIKFANKEAEKNNLNITYLHENYLELNLEENTFDLVILIYTDFGTLLPLERNQLLEIIKKVLKPKGTFIFDVLNDKSIESKTSPKSWEVSEKGFWKDKPYLALSDSYLYEEEKVILYQHVLLDEEENIDVYRFWTHFFSHSDLSTILDDHGYNKVHFYDNVLQKGDLWSGDNVTFCKAIT